MQLMRIGRAVSAQEALQFGLANRVVAKGTSKEEAVRLAQEIAKFPQVGPEYFNRS
jgi:enoyl-CoA hydratase